MTRIDGLNHVLCIRTVIRSDYGRGFGGLFGENGWRESKCVKISAFCYAHGQGDESVQFRAN
jgi:hypothetical protein